MFDDRIIHPCKTPLVTFHSDTSWAAGTAIISLEKWINQKPPKRLHGIRSVECGEDGSPLPFYIIPLPYRQTALAFFLIGIDFFPDLSPAWRAGIAVNREKIVTDAKTWDKPLLFSDTHIYIHDKGVRFGLPTDFSLGLLDVNHFGFTTFSATSDNQWGEGSTLIGTAFILPGQDDPTSLERHIPDMAFETFAVKPFHGKQGFAGTLYLSQSSRYRASLAHLFVNTGSDRVLYIYAVARSSEYLEDSLQKIVDSARLHD